MLNKKTNEFIKALTQLINDSGLPPVNVRLVLDVLRAQVIELEQKAMEQEEEEAAQGKEKNDG